MSPIIRTIDKSTQTTIEQKNNKQRGTIRTISYTRKKERWDSEEEKNEISEVFKNEIQAAIINNPGDEMREEGIHNEIGGPEPVKDIIQSCVKLICP